MNCGLAVFLRSFQQKNQPCVWDGSEFARKIHGGSVLGLEDEPDPIDGAQRSRLARDFGSFELEWENVPVFPVR